MDDEERELRVTLASTQLLIDVFRRELTQVRLQHANDLMEMRAEITRLRTANNLNHCARPHLDSKIPVIKLLRQIYGYSLTKAKSDVDYAEARGYIRFDK